MIGSNQEKAARKDRPASASVSRIALVRLAGLAGMFGAICWAIGDILLVGGRATVADFPLLLHDYADRIPFKALPLMLGLPENRLAIGALIADVSIPLYLAGSWHLAQGARPAGPLAMFAVLALFVCGNAWSPLGHAAFYYPGVTYGAILDAPLSAHTSLLALGAQFDRMLIIAWLLPVLTLAVAMTLLGLLTALGRTAYPCWAAFLFNPVVPLLVPIAASVLPDPLGSWFYAAVLNVGFLLVYALSTLLLWNGPAGRAKMQ
jgi:hypothetical protein